MIHHPMRDLFDSWGEWDTDCISNYYSVVPYDNDRWLTFSPVPFHCTVQWCSKLGISAEQPLKREDLFRHGGDVHFGVLHGQKYRMSKMRAVGTIDVERYCPRVAVCEPGERMAMVDHWFDCVSAYTNLASGTMEPVNWGLFESMTNSKYKSERKA